MRMVEEIKIAIQEANFKITDIQKKCIKKTVATLYYTTLQMESQENLI